MRIGIYSGLFNPPHIGHLNAAEQAFKLLRLDKIYIIPANYFNDSTTDDIADKEDRYQMCKAFMGCDMKATVSRMAIDKDGPSYTSDMIAALKEHYKEYPDDEYFLLIDAYVFRYDFLNWCNPEYLIDNVIFAVLSRSDDETGLTDYICGRYNLETKYKKEINSIFLHSEKIITKVQESLSSTNIRQRIKEGRKFEHLVPESVAKYIKNNNLYGYVGKLKE